eukprot:1156720-Pelagomonas_calceolata.AAC.8
MAWRHNLDASYLAFCLASPKLARWAGRPRIKRTKTASGRLWCREEEPVPIGRCFQGLHALIQESLISAGIHTNEGRAISAFAEDFNTEVKTDVVPIGVHPINGCMSSQGHGNVTSAVDSSQAYDTVPRLQLWDHLQRIAMPALLLQAIKKLYQDSEYILMDGDKRARVCPKNGVKQGCPLSPLLFSHFINIMGRDVSEGIRGAVTGDGVNGVSYMLYADDLSLTTNDPGKMKVMLNRLRAYAMRKGPSVNTSKKEKKTSIKVQGHAF